jgi:Tfp pilus assembly protein PilX
MNTVKSIRSSLRDESGSALIAGVLILMIIMMLGAVVLDTADVQTHQTGRERGGEMSFNVTESALNAEASLLENNWPSTSASAYPVCNQASTGSSNCPQGSVSSGYNTTYAGSGFSSTLWNVQVIDDNVPGVADANYYSDAILNSSQLQHWDSNGDNKVWIRANTTINGQVRTVVALMTRQSNVVSLPQNVVTSGGITTSNQGNKVIIQATDPITNQTGTVDLRCGNSSTTPASGDPCAGWNAGHGQLSPANAYQAGYVDPSGGYQTISSATLNAVRQSAQASGTYYAAGQCPPPGTTGLLFIEDDTQSPCVYTGPSTWNSDSAPGAIVVAKGTLTFNGTINFYGIVYMANLQGTVPVSGPCTPTQQNSAVFTVHGGGSLHGAIFIDKCGTVDAGDRAYDIVYDTRAFGGVHTFATPSLAQNTFRILDNP